MLRFLIFCICSLVLTLCASCVYDPPPEGKTIFIHNQTKNSVFVIDSLTGDYFKMYDTLRINNRPYFHKAQELVHAYHLFEDFYSNSELEYIKQHRDNQLTFYFVDDNDLRSNPGIILTNNLFRSIHISIDTIKKYDLNHLFVTVDTIRLEHHYQVFK